MLKFIGQIAILTSLILLTACGDVAKQVKEPQSSATKQPHTVSFKAEMAINLQSYHDQLSEKELPALEVLEKNLNALVEHDHTLFLSGFVNEKLAGAMEPYYSEQFQYKFTAIESIEQNLPNEHQVNITVIGERLDRATEIIDDVKMLYAIRPNDQGEWVIYTID